MQELRYAFRTQFELRIQCRRPNQHKTILDKNEYAKKEVGGRGGAYKSAAPRQEVAGRARQELRILSKLGGEASPSLRWLRLCRRPLPSTAIFRFSEPLFAQNIQLEN